MTDNGYSVFKLKARQNRKPKEKNTWNQIAEIVFLLVNFTFVVEFFLWRILINGFRP